MIIPGATSGIFHMTIFGRVLQRRVLTSAIAISAMLLAAAPLHALAQEQFPLDEDQMPLEEEPAQPPQDQVPPTDEEVTPAPAPKIERVKNPVAEFSGIDKITGRITSFDVYINETVQFGALQVTPRVCYSRPEAEEPKTDSFVEVDEITLDRKIRRIFTGWMFAESPGLNAVEHPVYDVWLKSCKTKSDVPAPDTAKSN
jgi:hypothetical protein